jgi:hypothetical protein
MAAARHADFYICHSGTQQHKIGWLYDVPGIIHTNAYFSNNYSTWWVAQMAMSPIIPAMISHDIVKEYNGVEIHDDITRRDYVFTDINKFCCEVISEMEKYFDLS